MVKIYVLQSVQKIMHNTVSNVMCMLQRQCIPLSKYVCCIDVTTPSVKTPVYDRGVLSCWLVCSLPPTSNHVCSRCICTFSEAFRLGCRNLSLIVDWNKCTWLVVGCCSALSQRNQKVQLFPICQKCSLCCCCC